jgi:hypothetical protein
MVLSFDRDHVIVPLNVVARPVDGGTVLLNATTGRYFTLDAIGGRAWAVLTSSPSLQAAFDTLMSEYHVEPDQLRHDLTELIDGLAAQGLLEVRHG